MKKIFLIILITLGQFSLVASGEHDDHDKHDDHAKHDDHDKHDDHGSSKAVGKGKAIEAVDEGQGFKLSNEAATTLNIKLESVNSSEFRIDKKNLVTSKSLKGIYRYRNGFFKFLEVKILKEDNSGYLVKCEDIKFADQIVISGVGLLRVSDVYSTDKSEYGHSH